MAGRKYTPPRRRDFSSCRWQTDDGVLCVRRGGLTQAKRKYSRPGGEIFRPADGRPTTAYSVYVEEV